MGDAVSDIAIDQFDDERVFAPSRRRLSAGLVLTIVLVAFEGLAVSTIMPIAVLDLHGLALYAWSFSGFMLGSLVGTVASGEYADRSGPAYPFIGALVVFSCGLVACGTATSMLVFITGRVIEGLGTGAVRSLVWLILRRIYPIRAQARMGAVLSSAWILPSLLGPTMAGVIARAWGWRVVFLALLPLAPMALAMVLRPLTRIEAEPAPAASSARAGATLLLAAGVALFIAGLQANSIPWIVVLVIAGAALSWPALDRILPAGTLLFRRGMPAALAMRGLLMFAYCEALAFFPLALEMVRGLSATTAGVALSMGSIGWTSGSWTQAACDYRFGPSSRPRIMLFGLLVLAIGIGGAAGTVVARYPLGVAIVAWGLAGLGMGICYNTSTVLSIQAETGHSAGTVSSSMQLTDSLGQTLGTGFGGAAMTLAGWASWGTSAGIGAAFALSVAVCAIGMALTPRLRSAMPRESLATSG
jgi:MFS family permease